MNEPIMVRCARCSALIAIQDAARCEIHETDPLCPFCWKDHWMRHEDDDVPGWRKCWTQVAADLRWR